MANPGTPQWRFFERHFTGARLRHYLDHCGGDTAYAIKLYVWNAEISAAFWESLIHLEVALRNTIDAQMTLRQRAKQRSSAWIFDDARELGRDRRGTGLHDHPYTDIESAKKRVAKNGKPLEAGQIISELPFGFWHQLVSRRQRFLWPDLAAGFPHMTGRNQATISSLVASLRGFRNRIGHHHRIWNIDVEARRAIHKSVGGGRPNATALRDHVGRGCSGCRTIR